MRIFSYLLIFTLFACSVDELPPCEGVGIPDEVCKEYQYVYGSYNGVNDYSYNLESGSLEKITTLKKNGREEGTTSYFYDTEGRVVNIEKSSPSGALISTEIISYDSLDRISSKTFSSNEVAVTEYIYEEGLLIAEQLTVDGVVEWIDSLEYYSGTSSLYRTLRYVNNELTEIKLLVEFINDITEETITNQNGIIQGKTVRTYNGGLLLEELNYSASGSLVQREQRDYENGKLSLITRFDIAGEEFERIEFYRF